MGLQGRPGDLRGATRPSQVQPVSPGTCQSLLEEPLVEQGAVAPGAEGSSVFPPLVPLTRADLSEPSGGRVVVPLSLAGVCGLSTLSRGSLL